MYRPILLCPASMHLLVPELRKQHLPAGVDEAAAISHHRGAIVTAQVSIEGTRRSATEGFVNRGGTRLVEVIGGDWEFREDIACIDKYRAPR